MWLKCNLLKYSWWKKMQCRNRSKKDLDCQMNMIREIIHRISTWKHPYWSNPRFWVKSMVFETRTGLRRPKTKALVRTLSGWWDKTRPPGSTRRARSTSWSGDSTPGLIWRTGIFWITWLQGTLFMKHCFDSFLFLFVFNEISWHNYRPYLDKL